MRRTRSTYHTLHVLKAAARKLRKAIMANCNQETLKSNCEYALNGLRGNIPLSACSKRKSPTYNDILRKVADNSVSLTANRKVISQRGEILLPRLSAILHNLTGLLFTRVNYAK